MEIALNYCGYQLCKLHDLLLFYIMFREGLLPVCNLECALLLLYLWVGLVSALIYKYVINEAGILKVVGRFE